MGLPVLLLVASSCARDEPADRASQRLIDSYSEARFAFERVKHEEHTIDFTSMSSLEGSKVRRALHQLGPDGLTLKTLEKDARLNLGDTDRRYNFLRIEMSSRESGKLRVLWRPAGSRFARSRSKWLPIRASEDFRDYEIDLSAELDPATGYRFRIDPIDAETEVQIKSIRLSRVAGILPDDAETRSAKVKVGNEVRQALPLRADSSIERTIRGGKGARLAFGLAKLRSNETPVSFRIKLSAAESERTIFEETIEAAGEVTWLDREADLGECPPDGCEIKMELAPLATTETLPGLFVSNPVVVRAGKRRPPNIVLISVDTLGARHVAAFDGPEGISPYIDSLAQRGVAFDNAFANSSATHTSHGSLLTGSAPFSTSYYWLDGAVGDEVTLAETVRQAGYLTAAFTAGILVSETLRFDKGFETFYQHDTLYRPPAEHSDVEPILDRALSWVERYGELPFFLFVHSYEVHSPYVPREADVEADPPSADLFGGRYLDPFHMRGRLPQQPSSLPSLVRTRSADGRKVPLGETELGLDVLPELKKAHHSEIRFLDRAIERFLETLRDRGALDDAIVVFTSDHGEAFFEHGLLEHGLLYDENLRVPVIFWSPERLPEGKRVSQQMSSMDIAPTILDLAGVAAPAEMEGKTLVPLMKGTEDADRDFYSLTLGNGLSWHSGGRYKLILRAALGQENFGRHELFDLVEDPLEQRNLLAEGVEISGRLERQMRRTVEEFPGIHVDFGAFAGATYELALPFPGYRDRLYAFDVERVGPVAEDSETLRCAVALSATSRLVASSRRKGGRLALALRPVDGGESLSFVLEPSDVPREKRQATAASGRGPALEVWRVSEPVGSAGGFSPQETEKLRALGYIQ